MLPLVLLRLYGCWNNDELSDDPTDFTVENVTADLLLPADVTDMAEDGFACCRRRLDDDLDDVPLECGGKLAKISPAARSSAMSATKLESLMGPAIVVLKSPNEGLRVRPDADMKELVMALTWEPLELCGGICPGGICPLRPVGPNRDMRKLCACCDGKVAYPEDRMDKDAGPRPEDPNESAEAPPK
jgi:hypothetical protein